MSAGTLAENSPLVFVSYSREDEQWRRRFTEMLKPLVRERRLDVWSDDRIVTGYEWRPQLMAAIGRSRAALLLVSPSFLASDFIMEQELPALVEQGTPLVPVLVRPCLWRTVPLLERLQWAHDPERDGPVANSPDPEGHIVRACLALNRMLTAPDAGPAPDWRVPVPPAAARAQPLPAASQPGDVHGVPRPPRAFVAREELAALREAVLGAADGAVGVTGAALGLHGQGGIGKTVLAAALARDDAIRRHFPDGVFWVTVGEQGDLVDAQNALLRRLGATDAESRSVAEGQAALRAALADRRCLLVVDDVWSAAAAAAFRVAGPAGRVLYTTRDPSVLEQVSAAVVALGVLQAGAARELLRGLTGVAELPAEADRICAATGGVALAVALVGAAIGAGGRSWAQAAAQLEAGGRTFLRHPYANTFKAMQVGVAALDQADVRAYRSLAVYPEDTTVPAVAVGRLWAHLLGDSGPDTAARLDRLAARSLLTIDRDGFSFHDLQREFLLLHTEDMHAAHRELLDAYRARLLPGTYRWSGLPPAEPYIWDNLIYHLRGAADGPAIQAVAGDLAWITRRCFRSGPYAAESDLRQAAALYPEDEGTGWLLRLLAQWGHLLTGHQTIGGLAATLASRLGDAPASVDAGTLDDLLPRYHLIPRWGLAPAQPGLGRVLEGHSGLVTRVAFTPDGHQLLSGDRDGTVHRWDALSGRRTGTASGTHAPVGDLVFSPDGVTMASIGPDGTARLWNLAAGRCLATLNDGAKWIFCLAFSADGRMLAGGTSDVTVRLWDPATGRPTGTLKGGGGTTASVAFSPDGRMLAAGSTGDGKVRLWDLVTGRRIGTVIRHRAKVHGDYRGVASLAFSLDGKMLASGGHDGIVRLRDLTRSLFAAPMRAWIAYSLDNAPERWRGVFLGSHHGTVASVAFSADGRMLASAGGSTVQVWDPATRKCLATLTGHYGEVASVAFSPRGRMLASGGEDGRVRLWDPADGQVSVPVDLGQRPTDSEEDPVAGVASSADGRMLASSGEDCMVRLWDTVTGHCLATLRGHEDRAVSLAFSPDGRILASGGIDGKVMLWDPGTGKRIATPKRLSPLAYLSARQVAGVGFSPDGSLLAGGSHRRLRLWNLIRGRRVMALRGRPGWFGPVAFSPDGRQLASGGADGAVRLWNLGTGRLAVAWPGHTGRVASVAFSPDGRLLASGGDDGLACLWDLAAGQLGTSWPGHAGGVVEMAFSPDGRLLASIGQDQTVRLWEPGQQQQVAQLNVGTPVNAISWGPRGIAVAGSEGLMLLAVIDQAAVPADGA